MVGYPLLHVGWVAGPGKFRPSGCCEVHSSAFVAPKGDFVAGHACLHFILTRVHKR